MFERFFTRISRNEVKSVLDQHTNTKFVGLIKLRDGECVSSDSSVVVSDETYKFTSQCDDSEATVTLSQIDYLEVLKPSPMLTIGAVLESKA